VTGTATRLAHPYRSAGLMSTTGVPSIASMGQMRTGRASPAARPDPTGGSRPEPGREESAPSLGLSIWSQPRLGGLMAQISPQEFERLPLRVHDFLAGVPLHDVWAVDLPRLRSGITLDAFLRTAGALPFTPSPVVRALVTIRLFAGRLLGWDPEPDAPVRETFATRLTPADLSNSLAPAGTREGLFRIVYRFENEQLLELYNRTAHAAALSALVETATAYQTQKSGAMFVGMASAKALQNATALLWNPRIRQTFQPPIIRALERMDSQVTRGPTHSGLPKGTEMAGE
jgi:Protein of unknown function (DUF2867)